MSTTTTRRTLAEAMRDAEGLRALFDGCYERWVFAGSLRRRRPDVSDIDHVVIAKIDMVPGDGLFGDLKPVNLLWKRADTLEARSQVTRHRYANGERWGDKLRGIDFGDFNNEISRADETNWGATLAIKTGPVEFSKRLVNGLKRYGRRNHKGQVWQCEPCQWCNVPVDGGKTDHLCRCEGTRLIPVEVIPVPDERFYFELCGVAWVEPERRA